MTIRIDGTNTAANPGITGTDTDTGLQFGTDEVNIVTGGSTAVTVDSSQRVGVGTSTPLAELEVQAATIPEVMVRNTTTSSYSSLHLAEVGDSSGTFVVNRLGSTSTATGGARAGQIWNSANAPIVFGTNGTEEMRLLAGGGLTFNGDTAAANALDDYEEGTFENPEIVPASGSFSSVTYHTDTAAKYIKIGHIVHYWGTVRWSAFSVGTGSGTLRITAPFQVASRENGDDSDNVGATIVPVWGGTSTAVPTTIQAQNGLARCILRATRHDAVSVVLLASDVGSTGMIAFSVTYRTP